MLDRGNTRAVAVAQRCTHTVIDDIIDMGGYLQPMPIRIGRRKIIPVWGGAGSRVIETLSPECKPVPQQLIWLFNVCWSA